MRTPCVLSFVFGFVLIVCMHASSVVAQEATTTFGSTTPTTTPSVAPEESVPVAPQTAVRSRDDIEAERRTQFAPLVKERSKNLFENVTNRLQANATRLSRIADRIESRTEKQEAGGYAITGARDEIEKARTSIIRAQNELVLLGDSNIDVIVDDESPRARFIELKNRVFAIRSELMNASTSLVNALTLLSNATPISIETSTTTP